MLQHSQPLDLEEALEQLRQQFSVVTGTVQQPLPQAVGMTLAADVSAPIDLPPFPASSMDGYAIAASDWQEHGRRTFTEIGTSLAGHPYEGRLQPGQCVRIFTGAQMPQGADQVLLQERVAKQEAAQVHFAEHVADENYVRPVGHDMQRGQQIAAQGQCITPFVFGALTAAGVAQVQVYAPLRVGVFSTGDELVDAGTPPAELRPGQIYDSNRATVLALLHDPRFILTDLGRLPDSKSATLAALTQAARQQDALVTSGGVSVGDADYVTQCIAQLGHLDMWKLNLKPGKPMAIGRIETCVILGLPGNPVSTIVTLLMLARPTLLTLCGVDAALPLRIPARLLGPVQHQPGRMEFQRGQLVSQQGELCVSHTGNQASNRLASFANANCLIVIDKQLGDLQAGTIVPTLPFSALLDTF